MGRSEIKQMTDLLPSKNVADVYRFVAGVYCSATGPAECQCCGKKIDDVRGLPKCNGVVDFWDGQVACANDGRHWRIFGSVIADMEAPK